MAVWVELKKEYHRQKQRMLCHLSDYKQLCRYIENNK